MKIFNAADFGIVPNEDISEKLAEFISALKDEDGEKTAVFDSGTYYIDSKRCKEYMLVITNTAGEKEFSPDETPHLNAVLFYFGGVSDLVFDGGDSIFVIDGKVTNIAVEDCRNITLRNLEIRHAARICMSFWSLEKVYSAWISKSTATAVFRSKTASLFFRVTGIRTAAI